MLEVITNTSYWKALDNPTLYKRLASGQRALDTLKHIQDYWMLNILLSSRNLKICEIVGANSRVLPALDASYERWNVYKFEDAGNGPTEAILHEEVEYIYSDIGTFDHNLKNEYFDIVFSISVLEHIGLGCLLRFWKDHARIMRQGGLGIHVVDIYLEDKPNHHVDSRISSYIRGFSQAGLRLNRAANLPSPLVFTCDMALNSNWGMWRWNKISPKLLHKRTISQSVSLAFELVKQ